MSKVFIFSAAVNTGLTWLAIIAVINSVISAYYYLRVLKIAFVDPEEDKPEFVVNRTISVITIGGMIGIIILGIFPSLLLEIAEIAVMSIVNI
jgi:NADH-quinone oxidoreductase subunit N